MPKKKIFISSTCYDLPDTRAELRVALKRWGYDVILSDSDEFPVAQNMHSHDICLDEVKECDIYLLVIDKRYGGTYKGTKYKKRRKSITWCESILAYDEEKVIITFVREKVSNEKPTYKDNIRAGNEFIPHHVDNNKVFKFIDSIVSRKTNNWITTFTDSVNLKKKLKTRLDELKKPIQKTISHDVNLTSNVKEYTGRKSMLNHLSSWYNKADVRVGAVVGWGGVGKSSLTRKWFQTLKERNIKPQKALWYGFYSNTDIERFLSALVSFMDDTIDLNELKGTWPKVDWVKRHINDRKYLIVLDGLEVLQNESGGQTGRLKNPEIRELLSYFADSMMQGFCLISTRLSVSDLEDRQEGYGYEELPIDELGKRDAKAILKARGVVGRSAKIDELIENYKRHALSLTTVAGFLVRYHEGDVDKAPNIEFEEAPEDRQKDVLKLFKEYFKVLTGDEKAFMAIFSLFRTNVTVREYDRLFRKTTKETEINKDLAELKDKEFITLKNGLTALNFIDPGTDESGEKFWSIHPITREYFASTLDEDTKAACHRAIYNFINGYAPERPDTIEEMAPLFEQIYHGCKGGLQDKAYRKVYKEKIQHEDEAYLVHKLGAWETNLSILRNFFPDGDFNEMPAVSENSNQSYLINETALSLLSIGKPLETDRLFLKKIKMINIPDNDWKNASVG
ncbi:MAG: DUF4062 domain-containing protein, partial [Thermodesulfobacteriota bacterium]